MADVLVQLILRYLEMDFDYMILGNIPLVRMWMDGEEGWSVSSADYMAKTLVIDDPVGDIDYQFNWETNELKVVDFMHKKNVSCYVEYLGKPMKIASKGEVYLDNVWVRNLPQLPGDLHVVYQCDGDEVIYGITRDGLVIQIF